MLAWKKCKMHHLQRVVKHPGLGYCSIKSRLMTTRWGEKLIVPESLENVQAAQCVLHSKSTVVNLTSSLPHEQMGGGGHELDVTRDKEILQYNLEVLLLICSFSELSCNP